MGDISRKNYIDKLKKYKDLDLIKVVTGIRRSGKSTILLQFIDELKKDGINETQIIYYNFEKIQDDNVYDYKLLYNKIIAKKKKDKKIYVFLDEIQEVNNFEKAINSLYLDKEIDIYITGSNANLLSSEIATYLTGRYVEIKIYPFSFKEYLDATHKSVDESFNDYLIYGGMPYTTKLDDKEIIIEYLQTLYNTILLKDIVKRKSINEVGILEDLSKFLCDNIGSIVSSKSISDSLTSKGRKVSSITVNNYIIYLCESLMFSECKRFDLKGKRILETLNKIYLIDQGFKTFLTNSKSDFGHILENIIYVELLRRNYNVKIGKTNELEIDFICTKNNDVKYIQVATSVLDVKTFERELRPLKSIKDNYEKLIISFDTLPIEKDGIKVINAKNFLLAE